MRRVHTSPLIGWSVSFSCFSLTPSPLPFASPLQYVYLSHSFGSFWLYAAISSAGWLLLFFTLPETKGKTVEEVGALFQ